MNEILNLSTRNFTVDMMMKNSIVELQTEWKNKFLNFSKCMDTSFNISPLQYVKDMIMYYNPAKVFVDDKTDIPGLIEMVCNDHKISVIKQSEKEGSIVEYLPSGEKKTFTF
jgi:hypothetical protein